MLFFPAQPTMHDSRQGCQGVHEHTYGCLRTRRPCERKRDGCVSTALLFMDAPPAGQLFVYMAIGPTAAETLVANGSSTLPYRLAQHAGVLCSFTENSGTSTARGAPPTHWVPMHLPQYEF